MDVKGIHVFEDISRLYIVDDQVGFFIESHAIGLNSPQKGRTVLQ